MKWSTKVLNFHRQTRFSAIAYAFIGKQTVTISIVSMYITRRRATPLSSLDLQHTTQQPVSESEGPQLLSESNVNLITQLADKKGPETASASQDENRADDFACHIWYACFSPP